MFNYFRNRVDRSDPVYVIHASILYTVYRVRIKISFEPAFLGIFSVSRITFLNPNPHFSICRVRSCMSIEVVRCRGSSPSSTAIRLLLQYLRWVCFHRSCLYGRNRIRKSSHDNLMIVSTVGCLISSVAVKCICTQRPLIE